MKNRENYSLSPKRIRQIEIISKYHKVDFEEKIIYLDLHYEKASEIIETDISSLSRPRFKFDILKRASDIISSFPRDYFISINIIIDDYENADPHSLIESFRDELEIFHYSIINEKNHNWIISVILVLVSTSLLFFRLFAGNSKIISTDGMFYEMLDIIAWVFLWEAVSVMFLSQRELYGVSMSFNDRVLKISLSNKGNETVVEMAREDIVRDFVNERKLQKTGRILLLLGGGALFSTAFMDSFTLVSLLVSTIQSGFPKEPFLYIFLGVYTAEVTLFALGGIGAFSTFVERGPFRKVVPVLAYFCILISLLLSGVFILLCVQTKSIDPSSVAQIGFSLFSALFYAIGYFVNRKFSKLNRKFIEKKYK